MSKRNGIERNRGWRERMRQAKKVGTMKRIIFIENSVNGERWTTQKYLRELVLTRPFFRTAGKQQLDCLIRVLKKMDEDVEAKFVDVTLQEHEWIEKECQLPDLNTNPVKTLVLAEHIRAISSALEVKDPPAEPVPPVDPPKAVAAE